MITHAELMLGISTWGRREGGFLDEITIIAQQPTRAEEQSIIDDIREKLERSGIQVHLGLTTTPALPWGRFYFHESTGQECRTEIEKWLHTLEAMGIIRVDRKIAPPPKTSLAP